MNLIIPYLVTIALPFLREKGNPSFYLWIDLNILIGNMTTLAYCQICDGIFFFFFLEKCIDVKFQYIITRLITPIDVQIA